MQSINLNFLSVIIPFLVTTVMMPLAYADTLSTPGFTVTVEEHCEEGIVGCDQVTYVGVSKKNGSSIRLDGKALMHNCNGTKAPCHHLGYQFRKGDVTYTVTDEGDLIVKRGAKELLKEHGEWLR